MSKPRIVVTREVFDETLDFLGGHCEVAANQDDVPLSTAEIAQRLQNAQALMCSLTDKVDAGLIAQCPDLKVVANIAVGYNNIDVAACTERGVLVDRKSTRLNSSH